MGLIRYNGGLLRVNGMLANSINCCCGGCPACNGEPPNEVQFIINHTAIDEDDVSFSRSVYCQYMHPSPSQGCIDWGYSDVNCRWGYCDVVSGETAIVTMSPLNRLYVDFIFSLNDWCYIASGWWGSAQIYHTFATKPSCCFDVSSWDGGALYNNCRNDWTFANTPIEVKGVNCTPPPAMVEPHIITNETAIIEPPTHKKLCCGKRIIEKKMREV